MREEEAISNAANTERDMMRLKATITDPTPYTESKRGAGLTSSSFGLPLLSQETPVRPLLASALYCSRSCPRRSG
eukprot:7198374-Pyramimonas_sp.AAC.1